MSFRHFSLNYVKTYGTCQSLRAERFEESDTCFVL